MKTKVLKQIAVMGILLVIVSITPTATNAQATCPYGDKSGVVLWEYSYYTGDCITLSSNYIDLNEPYFNDVASSVSFQGDFSGKVTLYQHTYYSGVSSTIFGNVANLSDLYVGDNQTSSIAISWALPDGNEDEVVSVVDIEKLNYLINYLDNSVECVTLVEKIKTGAIAVDYNIVQELVDGSKSCAETLTEIGKTINQYTNPPPLYDDSVGCLMPTEGVVLYDQPNYHGNCVTLLGDSVDLNSLGFSDQAASIRFIGNYAMGWQAVLYENSYYGGKVSYLSTEQPDLETHAIGRYQTSSIQIKPSVYQPQPSVPQSQPQPSAPPAQPQFPAPIFYSQVCQLPANGVVLYQQPNYQGDCLVLAGNAIVEDLKLVRFNDQAASIRFIGSYATGWRVALYQDSYYSGNVSYLGTDQPDFETHAIGRYQTSSIKLYPN